ncbi:hypothetical protein, partial [Citrobacter freundii]|uniref:hypothetical protein n=1 Tax=Citrobacter freundii TaxID=546 RepID=UPI00200105A6
MDAYAAAAAQEFARRSVDRPRAAIGASEVAEFGAQPRAALGGSMNAGSAALSDTSCSLPLPPGTRMVQV